MIVEVANKHPNAADWYAWQNPKAPYILDMDASTSLRPTLLDTAQSVSGNQYIDLDVAVSTKEAVDESDKMLMNNVTEDTNLYTMMKR